jgi:thiamine-phosphate pyrophosphorylase
MKEIRSYLGVYFITDSGFGYTHEELAEMALRAGIKIIQFREKRMPTKYMYETAKKIRKLTEDYSALFIVNDRIDIALAVHADGVHVGQEDMPAEAVREISKEMIVGVSAKNVDEAIRAEKDGADYIGAGPVFTTTTKEDAGKDIGLITLEEILKSVRIPVVAIGGINHDNAEMVLKTGCDGVAVISAIANSKNPEKSARDLIKIVKKYR